MVGNKSRLEVVIVGDVNGHVGASVKFKWIMDMAVEKERDMESEREFEFYDAMKVIVAHTWHDHFLESHEDNLVTYEYG